MRRNFFLLVKNIVLVVILDKRKSEWHGTSTFSRASLRLRVFMGFVCVRASESFSCACFHPPFVSTTKSPNQTQLQFPLRNNSDEEVQLHFLLFLGETVNCEQCPLRSTCFQQKEPALLSLWLEWVRARGENNKKHLYTSISTILAFSGAHKFFCVLGALCWRRSGPVQRTM